jgi:rRNA-processing protein EBP2
MAPTALAKKKTGPKPSSKPVEKKKLPPPPEPLDNPSSDDEDAWEDEDSGDESENDEEDEGIDEVGFNNLIKALGHDGLNEYDEENLAALAEARGR